MDHPAQWEQPAFLAQLCAQHPDAWQLLYEEFFAILAARFGEDIAQETFSEAYQHIATFAGRATLKGWFFGIARNLCADGYRTQAKESTLAPALSKWLQQVMASSTFERHQEAQHLMQTAIRRLSPDERQMFLAYLEGERQRDIAQALGMTEGAINTALSRIRAGLREEFAPPCVLPGGRA